ncbi:MULTISPECIES: ABC transporter substrate-binding protein [unclassified Streptomyces]|uniref:ABC transporter substrate-binding protein n=1 Tax=unclassified Streptomyces TaxID=2593676 RepID=UPI0008841B6B|nr:MULTISPECIES: extracellular solute-binding protein [unclassified Streptomyces]PBC82290.1 multiple sugar transport system substrate-binding protein [Streptomyces sp. 2321.6]SDR50434.1 multiple sugar transport system substrate-binding protein [Streptomyces sp. KS_16]SEC51688.1 multiple sugar transport system substrate-binding protein [Streptomyces sp. 2133.1]SNC68012.1 multiple sugar transport system substrate-binding protein [Streptomyces sp. 2114.4]
MTEINRRRLLAAGGGVALAAGLATACGSNTGRGGGGSGPALSQWYHQYGEPGTQQAVKRYAAAYRKADVSVQWRPGDYDRQTAAALLTDSGPDVFEANGPLLDQIQGGQVVDLTAEIEPVKDDFHQAVLAPKIWQDKIWGIPQVVDMQLLYYRKSLLKKAGVQPPQTLDELVDGARKLSGKKSKGLFLGNDGGVGVLGGTPLFAAGLSLISPDGKVGFDDPAAARTLGKIRQLYADKSLLLGAPTDWSDPAAFIQGLTAMQWSGLWALPQIKKALGDDFGVLPFPKDGSGGKPSVQVGAYGSAVSARSARKAAAKAFAKWLWVDRTDFQQDFALSYGFHIPARISLAKKARQLQSGPAADAVRLSTDHGYAEPLLWTTADRTAYQDALSRIIKDGANPESELKSVVRKVNAELQRVKKK